MERKGFEPGEFVVQGGFVYRGGMIGEGNGEENEGREEVENVEEAWLLRGFRWWGCHRFDLAIEMLVLMLCKTASHILSLSVEKCEARFKIVDKVGMNMIATYGCFSKTQIIHCKNLVS